MRTPARKMPRRLDDPATEEKIRHSISLCEDLLNLNEKLDREPEVQQRVQSPTFT